ncbi:MAG: hypothetical protein JO158_06315 [Gammaproteobacteria bacterium]|nr:hypothetical protein [Gammaproteobacteria bacterium]MBV9723753.1 hypothetical protein [Gammaproteobacteria bacterium]
MGFFALDGPPPGSLLQRDASARRGPRCINPLSWMRAGVAPATLDLGSLPAVAAGARRGFRDLLSLFGSYHLFDYNLFYLNIRSTAAERVAAPARPIGWGVWYRLVDFKQQEAKNRAPVAGPSHTRYPIPH